MSCLMELFPINADDSDTDVDADIVGHEMLTLSGTHDFTPFGEFMIAPNYCIYITEFV